MGSWLYSWRGLPIGQSRAVLVGNGFVERRSFYHFWIQHREQDHKSDRVIPALEILNSKQHRRLYLDFNPSFPSPLFREHELTSSNSSTCSKLQFEFAFRKPGSDDGCNSVR